MDNTMVENRCQGMYCCCTFIFYVWGITKSWNLMTSILGQIGSGFYIWCSFLVCIMLNEVCDPCRAWQWTISMLGRAQTPLGSQQRCWHWMAHWGSVCTTLLHCLAFMSAPHLSISCMPRLQLHLVRWELGHSPLLLVGSSNLKNGRIRTNSTISGDYNSLLSTESIAVKSWNKKLIRVLMNTAWWDIRQLMR